jgi:outer membrane protein OmpA-like peptidoglycan-associated protein
VSGYGSPAARAFFGLTFIPLSPSPAPEPVPPLPPPPKPVPPPATKPVEPPPPVVVKPVPPPPEPKPQPKPPVVVDSDGDGIPDDKDSCPRDKEDKDGYQDEDGCPEPDNDSDGIPDAQDKCPQQPETVNGFEDQDGCPDSAPQTPLVVVTKTNIEIKDKVYFKTGAATIEEKSFALLDQVALALKSHPDIKKLRVEGHTDDVGPDDANLRLSQARADSVRAYLLGPGKVEAARLVAVGYGETKPLTSNGSSRGREMNRRVVFTILEDKDGPTAASKEDLPKAAAPKLAPVPSGTPALQAIPKKKAPEPTPEPELVPLVPPKKK